MGKLADLINAPIEVEIAGQKLKAKQISITSILSAVTSGLKEMRPEADIFDLQDEACDLCNANKFPHQSIRLLLLEALKPSGVDLADVDALMSVCKSSDEYYRVIKYAMRVGDYTPSTNDEPAKKEEAPAPVG